MSVESEGQKTRVKRSWTRITTPLLTEGKVVDYTFWPTPEGLHRRRKGSPNVRTATWEQVNALINGDRFEFDHDNRHYEIWREADGIHVRRCGHEEHVVKWPQFIEFIDGQKLMPI